MKDFRFLSGVTTFVIDPTSPRFAQEAEITGFDPDKPGKVLLTFPDKGQVELDDGMSGPMAVSDVVIFNGRLTPGLVVQVRDYLLAEREVIVALREVAANDVLPAAIRKYARDLIRQVASLPQVAKTA